MGYGDVDYTDSTITKSSCPKCPSSDAFVVYDDGGFCFSCGYKQIGKNMGLPVPKEVPIADFIPTVGEVRQIIKRKLTEETCRKWGVECGVDDFGKPVYIFNHYDESHNIIGQKIRNTKATSNSASKYISKGNTSGLYGKWLWSSGKRVVITTGEIDCLSVSQALNNKYPVLSISQGDQSAKKVIKKNLNWLEKNFDEIILMFDMDESGQTAVLECAPLFSPGKCKVAKLPTDVKDANDLLMHSRSSEIVSAMWNAGNYEPGGVLKGSEIWDYLNTEIEQGDSLPWPSLSAATYGMRKGELWVWTAGSGIGKTSATREVAYHCMNTNNRKVGIISLEESPTQTLKRVASIHLNKPIYLPGVQETVVERREVFDAILGNPDKFILCKHDGNSDYDFIFRTMRYMVVGEGCNYIILDHLTAIVEGKGFDVNSECHKVMEGLNRFLQETGVIVHLVSHIRKSAAGRSSAEEGGRVTLDDLYGSGAIKQRANFVIALERDQQSDDPEERNRTILRVLKDRNTGQSTGFTTTLRFDHDTGRLLESLNDECNFGEIVGGEQIGNAGTVDTGIFG